jgi:hypothetical protein
LLSKGSEEKSQCPPYAKCPSNPLLEIHLHEVQSRGPIAGLIH